MMKIESKTRNASRLRKSRATMIAAFMFGIVTRRIRCHHVAPSTFAASWSTSGTWARPASRSSEMNGVVFQISAMQTTNSAFQVPPNQSVFWSIPGSQASHELTKPESSENAYCQANADTTVMTAYGMRIAARITGRIACSAFIITSASAKPRTSSTDTVTTVMSRVTASDVHQIRSVRMTA